MDMLRIKEAVARAERMGKKVMLKDIAARLYPDSGEQARQVNMSNLVTGRKKSVSPECVNIICEMCDCTPNYLFGYED